MRNFLGKLYPKSIINTLKNYMILSRDFGHYRTIAEGCIDKEGQIIPWYTYPAIEYIKQLNFSDKLVFEFGSGNSTIFWAKRCLKSTSVEDSQEWYEKMRVQLPGNVDYILCKEKADYIRSIHLYQEKFDIIIIDGNHRLECTIEALKKLNEGGIIILDNSDWHQNSAQLLRNADLIEVDMSGFGPINGYTWTTSFFFSRAVKLKPAINKQPQSGIGSIK